MGLFVVGNWVDPPIPNAGIWGAASAASNGSGKLVASCVVLSVALVLDILQIAGECNSVNRYFCNCSTQQHEQDEDGHGDEVVKCST